MYELVPDKPKYLRVRRGAFKNIDIENFAVLPEDCKEGEIVALISIKEIYVAQVGDDYKTIAEKFKISESMLTSLNGNKTVYPTMKVLLPE